MKGLVFLIIALLFYPSLVLGQDNFQWCIERVTVEKDKTVVDTYIVTVHIITGSIVGREEGILKVVESKLIVGGKINTNEGLIDLRHVSFVKIVPKQKPLFCGKNKMRRAGR